MTVQIIRRRDREAQASWSVSVFFSAALWSMLLLSCVNQPRNYIPAGFESEDAASAYVPHNIYLASKLSDDEWDAFFDRFPEYWKDLEAARGIGSTMRFHPWYTAYAFRWITLRRREA